MFCCSAAQLLGIVLVVFAVAVGTAADCNVTAFEESLNFTVGEVSCYGGSDGNITIGYDETLGCTPSLFSIIRNVQISSLTNVFTGLSMGDYDVVVKFSNTGSVAKTNVSVGSVEEVTFTFEINDLNAGECDACDSEATVKISGGKGPYIYNNSEVTSEFSLTGLCYGNTSFLVMDNNSCIVEGVVELPFPDWCLMSNESESSASRDYWTLPEGMLPWLLAICALVAVFILAVFISCCVYSCVSEKKVIGTKQKSLEEGNAGTALISKENNHSDEEKEEEKEPANDSDNESDEGSDKEDLMRLSADEEEAPEQKEAEKKEEKSKSDKKKNKKRKVVDEGAAGEVELGEMNEGGDIGAEKKPKKRSHHRKHKSASKEDADSLIEQEA